MSDPGTLGAAASGTCFVIFTIGLAMFTLLKSFQIIKNRKTFEHYCFSTLQRAGEEEERSGFSSSVNKWNVSAGQGDICCLVRGCGDHLYHVMLSTHTQLSAFLLWLTPHSCCPHVPGFLFTPFYISNQNCQAYICIFPCILSAPL